MWPHINKYRVDQMYTKNHWSSKGSNLIRVSGSLLPLQVLLSVSRIWSSAQAQVRPTGVSKHRLLQPPLLARQGFWPVTERTHNTSVLQTRRRRRSEILTKLFFNTFKGGNSSERRFLYSTLHSSAEPIQIWWQKGQWGESLRAGLTAARFFK